YLRKPQMYRVLRHVFCRTADLGRFRLVHYSVQRNHLHFVVEASDRASLTKGMRCLCIRVAKNLNTAMDRPGRVLSDRYHEQHLLPPAQVKHSLGYVPCNARRHLWKDSRQTYDRFWLDPFSSALFFTGWKDRKGSDPSPGDPVARPRTWLVRI